MIDYRVVAKDSNMIINGQNIVQMDFIKSECLSL